MKYLFKIGHLLHFAIFLLAIIIVILVRIAVFIWDFKWRNIHVFNDPLWSKHNNRLEFSSPILFSQYRTPLHIIVGKTL